MSKLASFYFLNPLTKLVEKVPEFFEGVFLAADVLAVIAAEFSFEAGHSGPRMFGVVWWGDAEEVVVFVAALLGLLYDVPLQEIGSHDVAIFITGSAVVVGGGVAEEGGDEAADHFAFVEGEVEAAGVALVEAGNHEAVESFAVSVKAVALGGFRDDLMVGAEVVFEILLCAVDFDDFNVVFFCHLDVVAAFWLHLLENVLFAGLEVEDERVLWVKSGWALFETLNLWWIFFEWGIDA